MRLALGTVQFGKKYGISNKSGQTSRLETKKILRCAKEAKITLLDSATGYGNSEELLGTLLNRDTQFKIVTKTPYLRSDSISNVQIKQIKTAFHHSLQKLQKTKIYALLVHNANNLLVANSDALYNALLELKLQNKVQKIGISVYDSTEIDRVLEKYPFDIVQLPINLLDQRLINSGHLKILKKMNIEVHARSIFLQGLLQMSLDKIPPYFKSIYPLLSQLHTLLRTKNVTITQAAISFVKQINELDYILVGVNTKNQLMDNIKAFRKEVMIDFSEFAIENKDILNPSKWQVTNKLIL